MKLIFFDMCNTLRFDVPVKNKLLIKMDLLHLATTILVLNIDFNDN